MTEPHLHCGECRRVIETTAKNAAGKTIEVPVSAGVQFGVRPGPDGLQVFQIQVPLCPICFEKIEADAKRSKILVPTHRKPV